MKKADLYIDTEAPSVRGNVAWLKPVDGGVALYVLDGGWKPLKLVDDKNTPSEGDDTVENVKTELIGNVQDEASTNTINGAKTYAKDQANSLLGTAEDTATEMTLYGLKAYIDSKVPGQ